MPIRICFLFLLVPAINAHAFPENVRHGYVNCTACHVSPAGGGLLTDYGRSLSKELMSTWGREGEENFLYGVKGDHLKWLKAGGNLRAVQTYRDNVNIQKAELIPMQADLEAGYDQGKFAAIATVGMRSKVVSERNLDETFSRRHYLLYRFTDEISIRGGKFQMAYGLGSPDHVIATRRGLGWDQGSESYNVEFSCLGETVSYYLTFVSDQPAENGVLHEKGGAISGSYFLWNDSKVGFSYFYGSKGSLKRNVFGPYGIISFMPNLYLLSELDWQLRADSSSKTTGFSTFNRLNYEIHQGVIPFIQYDRSMQDVSQELTLQEGYGLGIQFLPRPHLELVGFFSKEKIANQPLTDFYWLMLHYYL